MYTCLGDWHNETKDIHLLKNPDPSIHSYSQDTRSYSALVIGVNVLNNKNNSYSIIYAASITKFATLIVNIILNLSQVWLRTLSCQSSSLGIDKMANWVQVKMHVINEPWHHFIGA